MTCVCLGPRTILGMSGGENQVLEPGSRTPQCKCISFVRDTPWGECSWVCVLQLAGRSSCLSTDQLPEAEEAGTMHTSQVGRKGRSVPKTSWCKLESLGHVSFLHTFRKFLQAILPENLDSYKYRHGYTSANWSSIDARRRLQRSKERSCLNKNNHGLKIVNPFNVVNEKSVFLKVNKLKCKNSAKEW